MVGKRTGSSLVSVKALFFVSAQIYDRAGCLFGSCTGEGRQGIREVATSGCGALCVFDQLSRLRTKQPHVPDVRIRRNPEVPGQCVRVTIPSTAFGFWAVRRKAPARNRLFGTDDHVVGGLVTQTGQITLRASG